MTLMGLVLYSSKSKYFLKYYYLLSIILDCEYSVMGKKGRKKVSFLVEITFFFFKSTVWILDKIWKQKNIKMKISLLCIIM